MQNTNFKSFLLCKYKSLESPISKVHRLNLPSYLTQVPLEMHCEKRVIQKVDVRNYEKWFETDTFLADQRSVLVTAFIRVI